MAILLVMSAFIGMAAGQGVGEDVSQVILYGSPTSLTLYVPHQVSLNSLTISGNGRSYTLGDLRAFQSVPWNNLPVPMCFQLKVSGASEPNVRDCDTQDTLIETIAQSDNFWYTSNVK
jgi:hypothetical protein